MLWFDYLVDITKTRPVVVDDLWQLDDADRSARTHDRFAKRMKRPRDFVAVALRLHWRPLVASAALSLVAAAAGVANPLLFLIVTNAVTIDRKPTAYVTHLLVLYLTLKGVFKLATQHSRRLRANVATRTLGAIQTMLFDATIMSTWSQDVTVSEASNMFHELTSVYEMLVLCHDVWIHMNYDAILKSSAVRSSHAMALDQNVYGFQF